MIDILDREREGKVTYDLKWEFEKREVAKNETFRNRAYFISDDGSRYEVRMGYLEQDGKIYYTMAYKTMVPTDEASDFTFRVMSTAIGAMRDQFYALEYIWDGIRIRVPNTNHASIYKTILKNRFPNSEVTRDGKYIWVDPV